VSAISARTSGCGKTAAVAGGNEVGELEPRGVSVTRVGRAAFEAGCAGVTGRGADAEFVALHATRVKRRSSGQKARSERASGSKLRAAMRLPAALGLGVLSLTVACSASKSDIALTGRVDSPTLAVQSSSVGADATGGFSLAMELGAYASGDTLVSLGTFSIQRDDQELLTPLSLAGATFPVSLGVGKKVMLPLTFDASTDPATATTICQGPVLIAGTLMDTLSNNHPTPVTSGEFTAQCTSN
jgi:hypothetical protein